MNSQLKMGVIGVGRMGARHCRVYSNMRKVHLFGVSDKNPEVGVRVARMYDVPYFRDPEELLAQVDAVSLAVPTPLHYEQAMVCINRGVNVLIEKPITETVEQGEKLVKAAEESGKVVVIGHIERFNPAYMELKNVVEGMDVITFDLRRLSPFEGSNKDVDVVLDLMIHDTNLVLDLVGKDPVSMHAHGVKVFSENLDHASATLSFPNNILVTMTASRITEQKVRTLNVACRNAYLECDLLNKSILVNRSTIGEYQSMSNRTVKYRQESVVEKIFIPGYEPLMLELQHFVDCVMGECRSEVSANDGLKALKLATAIRDACLSQLTEANVLM
jgi:predicted dehydrogenase